MKMVKTDGRNLSDKEFKLLWLEQRKKYGRP